MFDTPNVQTVISLCGVCQIAHWWWILKKLLGVFWVWKTMYLFTVAHCACFLTPFTVTYNGTKGIADFHKLRITLLGKNRNQNMNLTNEISGCSLRVRMKVVFFLPFFFLNFSVVWSLFLTICSATNTQTLRSRVPRGPKDCPEFDYILKKRGKKVGERSESLYLWVSLWNPFERQRKISYLAPGIPCIWSE